jgi:dienelactone hydrolase
MISRRRMLTTGAGVTAIGALGAIGWEVAPHQLKAGLGLTPDAYVPDVPEGQVRLERLSSEAMGGEVDLFTAVPHGYGAGEGLPVVLVLHGANGAASKFRGFGFGRFVTASVERGAPPFVLAGTDDGPAGWLPTAGADPQAMLLEELPTWLARRGFDSDRTALWGWSRGGYGAVHLTLRDPARARAVALFSPALHADDPVLGDLATLSAVPMGIWCGDRDPWVDGTRALGSALPHAPERFAVVDGAHTRAFWNDHTLPALGWLAGHL